MLSGFFVTKKGKNLLAKTHDGANIELTRAEIGSGDIPEGQLVTEVTSLYGKVKELPLGEVKVGSGKEVCIPVQLTNKGVLTSFLFKEIGVYAIDPDEGEILYLYGNTDVTGDVPDEVKSESESQVDYLFNLLLNIDNTTKVDVNVDNSLIYATLQNLSDMADTKVDKVSGKGLSTEDYTTAEKNKLAGIEAGANKYIHPATHPVGMITGLGTAATKDAGTAAGNVPIIGSNGKLPGTIVPADNNKVDKVTGKGLSTNDYTTAEKNKLAGIAAGANKYIHPATHPVSMITGLGTAATKDVGTAEGNVVEVNSDGKIDSTLIGGGHADTADKLKTPRSIALTEGATGTAMNFDGSANISIPVTGLDASKLTSGTVPTERLSPDPGAYVISPRIGPSDTLYASLDYPTLAEIGAVDSTFTNKIAFYPYEYALCEISTDSGMTWNTDTRVTEAVWKELMSENNNANIKFTPDKQYRITVTSKSYSYLSALYLYANTNGNKISLKIEKYNNATAAWSDMVAKSNEVSGVPRHCWLQHATIAFSAGASSSIYCGKMRLTIIPTVVEGYEMNDILLYGLRWYGTFPGTDHRTIYSWDEDKNVTFPAQLKASEVYDNNQRVYSPVNKPSAEDLGAATSSHTHNLATTAESGYMSGADKTKVEATNVAYGTCSTAAATAAKVVTLSGNTNWKLVPGSMVVVKFTYTNTATNPTLNVNGTGAKSIWVNTAVITTSNLTYAGIASRPIKFVYDGTYYVVMGWSGDDNSTYALMTAAEATTGTATNAKLISAKVLHDKIEEMLSESLSGSGTGQTWHAKDILGSGTTSTADATAESGYSVTIDTTAKNIDGSAKKYKAPFGTYVAIFRVQASTVTGSADKIKLEIWGASAAIASRAVKLSDFSAASKWEYFKIPFETDSTSGRDIYPKVTCLNATGNVKVDNIVVVPNAFALM